MVSFYFNSKIDNVQVVPVNEEKKMEKKNGDQMLCCCKYSRFPLDNQIDRVIKGSHIQFSLCK